MSKRILTAVRTFVVALMTISILSPVHVAEATGAITKEITVLGIDGSPYVGALVGMSFQSEVGASRSRYSILPVITNSSGVATLSFSDTHTSGYVTVQPPATDTSTAMRTEDYEDHANNSPLSISLSRSVLRVNIRTADNQPAPISTSIFNGEESFSLIRTGVANFAPPSSAPTNTCLTVGINPAATSYGSHSRSYGAKLIGSGETQTATLYNDTGTCAVEAEKSDGVYQVKFLAGNISGNLLSNSGQALSFLDNEGYEIQTRRVNSDGTRDFSARPTVSTAQANGSWSSYVDTSTAGRYELSFISYGNPDNPSFFRKYIWVTNDLKLSWSADGSSPEVALSRNFNLPLPNIKISLIDTITSENVATRLIVQRKIDGGSNYDVSGIPTYIHGRPSLSLDDGDYRIGVGDMSGTGTVTLSFSVASGVATFLTSSRSTYSIANSVYTVWLPANNVRFSLKDAQNNPVNGSVTFCTDIECYFANPRGNGLAMGYVPDGNYPSIEVNPGGEINVGGLVLAGSVTNGVLSITGKTAIDGVFALELPTANVRFTVTHPTTSSLISSGSIQFEGADSNWERVGGRPVFSRIMGSIPGYAKAFLPDGRYLATVNADSWNIANAGLAGRTYRVTVSSGVASISFNNNPIEPIDGKFPVSPSAANLEITVQNLLGTAITDGWVDFCPDLGGGATNSCRGYGFNNMGQVSHSLTDGNWVIVVRPGSSTGMSVKRYSASVSSGVVTVSGATQTSGRWILTGTAPNISGSFTLASGSLSFVNNQGISLNVQKYNNGNWEWQKDGSWNRSQNYVLNITSQGHYRIVANPIGFLDLVQSYSDEFWVNGSSQVSTIENGTYTDSVTALNIRLKTPNLKLKVINPLDGAPISGGWVSIEKITAQSRNWVANADINSANPGLTGANLTETGTYQLTVNPPGGSGAIVGLATRIYQLTVDANDSMTVTLAGIPVALDGERFLLAPATANVTARIVKADGTAFGNSSGRWMNVNLQKFMPEKNSWEYSNTWANGDQDGYISMRADAAGKYRLRIQPNGDADATITYSQEFVVTSDELNTFKKDFGNIVLRGPSIRVSVATPSNSSTALLHTNIEIRKDGNWIDWANTSNNGVAGISLDVAGTYDFIVHPSGDLQGSSSRKSYRVTALNSDGVITATATAGTGVSTSNGVTTLLLGVPTITGTVLAPSPSTIAIANSSVVAMDTLTGKELWENSANTNSSGAWSMSLPAGTYKIYARTPWGTSTYGASDGVGDVVVDSSGVATAVPAGQSASGFTIRLKEPTWSGLIKNPAGTAVVPSARVCLLLNNKWDCVNADANGAWALSAPAGFTSFVGTNPLIDLSDDVGRQFPFKRIQGESAVNSAIGTSGSNIILQFAEANTQITVTAGGNPVANAWVSAERDGSGWLGGGSTNANGVAKLNITSPSEAFKVRVELNGNPIISQSYATTMKTFSSSDITGGVFTGTVALAEPNFRVVLREPTSDGSVGNILPYSWIELYSDTSGQWLGGSSTDANGFASFKLDAPSSGVNNYTVTVNPSWNATTNFSRQAYAVAVSPTETTVINKTSTSAINLQEVSGRNVYPLTLGTPSVTGVVVNPDGGTVANSWVLPRDAVTSDHYWSQAVNSRRNGEIAINLINGQYTLEANAPWGTSNVAKSASCAVTVSGGTISTGGACVQDGATKTVRLALRTPNVTFTLKIGGAAVANANVGIGSGKWFTNVQSDSEGKVSLFVDAPAIRSMNNYTSAQPLYVWVNPPYGGSVEMARWDCSSTQSKPICSGLVDVPATGDYPTKTLGDVTGVSPNTRIRVVAPSTSINMPNSWVVVFAFDPANVNSGRRWLGGGNSNSSGISSMNLDTSTVLSTWRFAVEINAPWNERALYATNLDTNSGNGFTWSELTGGLEKSPKTPNLILTVNASNAVANKFGWIGVEEINSTDVYQSWVGGFGLNESGVSSVFLAASKRYRITSYPGPGRSGARTSCIVTTNVSEVVSAVSNKCDAGTFTSGAVTIALDGGNVVGRVTKSSDNSPLVGAIVYANNPNAVDESTAVITSTDTDGRYGLQLDPTKTWNIKIFPTGAGSQALGIGTETGITPPSSDSITRNFSIGTP